MQGASDDISRRAAGISTLQEEFPGFASHLLTHLDEEERNLQPVVRKLIPLEVQKQLLAKMWEVVPSQAQATMTPWLINNMPMMMQVCLVCSAVCWCRCRSVGWD